MTAFRRLTTITLLGFVLLQKPLSGADTRTYDLVIYGTTSAGITAAVQAKRMNLDVVVVGPDKHLGGLSAGGSSSGAAEDDPDIREGPFYCNPKVSNDTLNSV